MTKELSGEIDHRIPVYYDAKNDLCHQISYKTQAVDVMFEDGSNLETTIKNLKAHGDDVKTRSATALSSIGVETDSDADWDDVIEHIYDAATVNYNKGYDDGINNCVYNLGKGTSFDVSHIPGYQNLTKDNFVIVAKSIYSYTSSEAHAHGSVYNSVTIKPTCSYNNSTGVLTIKNMGASYYAYPADANGAYSTFRLSDYEVLLITGNIKTI